MDVHVEYTKGMVTRNNNLKIISERTISENYACICGVL